MKIIFVSGGSYKSFYLNYYLKLNRCDLLVFNFGVIYDYDETFEEGLGAIVKPEMIMLANRLGATVIAGINLKDEEGKRGLLVCDGKKINIFDAHHGLNTIIKKKHFFVGDETSYGHADNKIILSKSRIYPKLNHCSLRKCYLFCDSFGLAMVKKRKLKRNFNKYSKIILK